MTDVQLRNLLKSRSVKFKEESVQHGGICFRCDGGEVFTVFPAGTVLKQGKTTELTRTVVDASTTNSSSLGVKTVFIVYGHDIEALKDLELIIHRMGLEPVVLGNKPGAGDTLIEKLEDYIGRYGNVGYACVLLTPDDEGNAVGSPGKKRPRARQNVVLELGMVLARLDRKRVAILLKEEVEKPSDIAGLIYIAFKDKVSEQTARLFKEFNEAGLTPDPSALGALA